MTNLIFLLQFFLILLIFVFPPLFVDFSDNLALDFSKFNYLALISLVLALFLYLQDRRERFFEGKEVQENKKTLWKAVDWTGGYFLTFGSLVLCAAIIELASLALKTKNFESIIFPSNFLQGLFCAFALAASAFYEECLYRLYLPKALKKISARGGTKSIWLCEAACVLLFAFAHRYQGLLALLNAFLAGIILRLSFIKSKSLFPPFFAHLSYNAAAFLFYKVTLVP